MARDMRSAQVKRDSKAFWSAITAARAALCARPLSQAEWLLTLSRTEISALSIKETLRLRAMLLVFAKGTPMPRRREGVQFAETDLPTLAALEQAVIRAKRVFGLLAAGRRASVETNEWQAWLQLTDGRIIASVSLDGLSLLNAFTVRLYETLLDLPAQRAWLHSCSVCQEAFFAKRRDAEQCSSSCRTIAWRRAHPEKFKKQRHEQYVRARNKKKGLEGWKVGVHTPKRG